MSQKFKIGDQVLVVIGEGLDTPAEAQGKTGKITGLVGESEYWIEMPDGQVFSAAFYHIIPVPKIMNPYDPEIMAVQLLNKDPDLREKVLDTRNAIQELKGRPLSTVLLVMAWCGYDALNRNPRLLEGSGIHDLA